LSDYVTDLDPSNVNNFTTARHNPMMLYIFGIVLPRRIHYTWL